MLTACRGGRARTGHRVFEAAYDEHARRLARLYAELWNLTHRIHRSHAHERTTAPHHRHRQLPVSRLAGICLANISTSSARPTSPKCRTTPSVALHDQLAAGLDVITDGEQTRLDFNLSFYGFSKGSSWSPRADAGLARPPTISAGNTGHRRIARAARPGRGGGVQAPAKRQAPSGPVLKASVPGPYTLSGRLVPNRQYPDRWALTEALLPIVRKELEDLVAAGCREISVDEPSHELLRRTRKTRAGLWTSSTAPSSRSPGRCRLSTHLCFGNYKARAVGPRRYAPMFPGVPRFPVDEIHVEMASREFAEIGTHRADRRPHRRRRRHHRREELLHRNARRRRRAGAAAA